MFSKFSFGCCRRRMIPPAPPSLLDVNCEFCTALVGPRMSPVSCAPHCNNLQVMGSDVLNIVSRSNHLQMLHELEALVRDSVQKQPLWDTDVFFRVLLSYAGNEIGQKTPAHKWKKSKEFTVGSMHTYCFWILWERRHVVKCVVSAFGQQGPGSGWMRFQKNYGRQGGEDCNSQDECLSYLVSLFHMRRGVENVHKRQKIKLGRIFFFSICVARHTCSKLITSINSVKQWK